MRRASPAVMLVTLVAAFTLAPAPVSGSSAPEPYIITVAGGGPDDTPATQSHINAPVAPAYDAAGNLYVAASGRIFRVDGTGVLTVYAGDGGIGTAGDGGPARQASFGTMLALAADPAGNLYVSEFGALNDPQSGCSGYHGRVRRIEAATGVIDTVAGGGACGAAGDRLPARDADLLSPMSIALDAAGDLLIADHLACNVRKVDASRGTITTVAGTGTCGYDPASEGGPATEAMIAPGGLAIGAHGDLLVAGLSANRIFRVDQATGTFSTLAGGGAGGDGSPALDARLEAPRRIALDSAGNLYFTEGGGFWSWTGHRVRRIDAITGLVLTVAGGAAAGFAGDGGPAAASLLDRPDGLAVDPSGSLVVADSGNHRVRRIDAVTGLIDTIAGDARFGDGGPATRATLRSPGGIARDAAGNLYIADTLNQRVRRVDRATGLIGTVAGTGVAGFSGDGGPADQAMLNLPTRVAVDLHGNLFIADHNNRRIRKVDAATGTIATIAGGGPGESSGDGGPASQAVFDSLQALAVDGAGNLFIADSILFQTEPPCETGCGSRIRRIDAATGIITTIAGGVGLATYGDGGPAALARFVGLVGLGIDPSGNLRAGEMGYDPEWYDIRYPTGNYVRRIDAITGVIDRLAGNGAYGYNGDGIPATSASLFMPSGVAGDEAGDVFIAEAGNHRLRVVDAATGLIASIAGDGVPGFNGDGIPAAGARLSRPSDILIGDPGDLYVADSGNNRVRLITSDCAKLPPLLSVQASPAELWPPNHRLVEVTIAPSSVCAPGEIVLASVTSSEPDDAPGGGDGGTTGDIQDADIGTSDFVLRLRSERDAGGDGRTYTVTYSSTGSGGASIQAGATIFVPRARGGRAEPLEITVTPSAAGTLLEWTVVPGALSYDALRGDLDSPRVSGGVTNLGILACVETASADTTSAGHEDAETPAEGEAFFYLVEYFDADGPSGLGTADAALPAEKSAGGCR